MPAVPLVLVVGCPAEFVAACREAGNRLAVAVRDCDVGALRGADPAGASLGQPFAVIVTEDLYRFAAAELDALARGAGASLIRIEAKDACGHDARTLLVDAIFESAATGPGSGFRPAVR